MVAVKEEHFLVPGPAGTLEVAAVLVGDGDLDGKGYCAVICHPHPLHGGTMDNKVVTTLARAYRELGIPVARFNFRGVGSSEGVHDKGIGEVEDLRAVVNWLAERTDADKVLLAGFSFGTGVVSNYCSRREGVAHVVLVAPPVGRYNFAPVDGYPCPVCVIMGGRDELVDAQEVYRWAERLTPLPELIRIPEATHFFHGQLVKIRQDVMDVLNKQLKS